MPHLRRRIRIALRRIHLVRSERGSVMLEFVLVSPLLCYLIAAILYFRANIDYAQDSIINARQTTWLKALPNDAINMTDGDSSDDNRFFLNAAASVRTLTIAATAIPGVTGLDKSVVGTGLAVQQYLGAGLSGAGTPYETLGLKIKNYYMDYPDTKPMPPEPWSQMLGAFGRWWNPKMGYGEYKKPDGLTVVRWKDKFPMSVNPWMRSYSAELDGYNFHVPFLSFAKFGYLIQGIAITMNLYRTSPLPRVDTRDDIDVGADPPDDFPEGWGLITSGTCDKLKLKTETSKSTIETIVS